MCTLLYQRPLLQLYECNVNITHNNGICESKQGFLKKKGRDVNINFFIVQTCFVLFGFFFFLFKAHIILL